MSVEIALRAVRVGYGPVEALHGVDLAVPAGRLTVLLGRNGAGRTTALRAMAGTVRPGSGRVEWRGADVTRMPPHARARRGLVHVPDRGAVFPSLTVSENLALASPEGRFEAVLASYPALRERLGHRAGSLSGGEQRMLAVARALLSPARLLLLDEPFQGMAPAIAERTYALLGPTTGRTVVVAEQALPPGLRAVTAVVYELRRGTVVFCGEPSEWPGGGGATGSAASLRR